MPPCQQKRLQRGPDHRSSPTTIGCRCWSSLVDGCSRCGSAFAGQLHEHIAARKVCCFHTPSNHPRISLMTRGHRAVLGTPVLERSARPLKLPRASCASFVLRMLQLSSSSAATPPQQLEAAEHQARWAVAMQRGRRSRRSGRGRRPHHRPRCATLLYPCLSRPAHGRLRSVYVVVAGTSFNTDTYHQTRPYCQLCGTVHPSLRSPDAQIAPHGTHTRRKNRRANGTHAAHRDARQRPMQHRATIDSGRLEVGGSLHSSGGRRSSARCGGCKGVQAARTAKLARGELVGQTGEGEGR